MLKEMLPPPLPPKTRGISITSNSCSAGAGATVFVRPSMQVHSSRDSTTNGCTPVTADHLAGSGAHVVKIQINTKSTLDYQPSINQQPIVSSIQLNCSERTIIEPTPSVVRISIGESHQSLEDMRGGTDRNAYFFCNGGIGTMMSSGQCSPSDTLDSGTCSDLDGTPPPLPKKKSVTVTVIGAQHKRASSLTSSGADADSASGSDNESNISCDSLNSADLQLQDSPPSPLAVPPSPPSIINFQRHSTQSTNNNAFLPQGLLQDIRDRSAKLVQPQDDITITDVTKTCIIIEEPQIQPQQITITKSASPIVLISESTYEERQEQKKTPVVQPTEPNRVYTYESDKYYKFHLNEHLIDPENDLPSVNKHTEEDESFAGYKDILGGDGSSTIRSAKGTVRGVKNRVRAGIATFLQINDVTTKSFREKDAGKVVVYSTTMGIVRNTYQQCVKVKQILRTHLVKFEERDVFMSGEFQQEIRERMRCDHILIPQVFVDGQHVGDAETIERLNETGELRKILKPYKSADACNTCSACGGYRLLPCPVCNGSKKSVHRNHFTTEFVALKCMNCDEVGLVRCSICS